MGLVSLRAAATFLIETYGVGQRKACELMGVARSSFRYQSRKDDRELTQELVQLAQAKPRYGYRRLLELLKRVGRVPRAR